MNEGKIQRRWLSAGALTVVIGAWAAAGVYGWIATTQGVMAVIAIALTIGCQIYGARALKNAAEADNAPRRLALLGLGGFCLVFVGYSGHQGLAVSEAARWAPYDAQQARVALADAAQARLDAVPPLPLVDGLGRPIGPVRTGVLAAERRAEVYRLADAAKAARDAVGSVVARPAPKMPEPLSWAIVGLIEALEMFGFYALGRGGKAAKLGSLIERNPGRALANVRWRNIPNEPDPSAQKMRMDQMLGWLLGLAHPKRSAIA